jgi:hypothetical protein
VIAPTTARDTSGNRTCFGVDLNAYSPPGFHPHGTALHHAVDSGSLDAVKVLVEAGTEYSAARIMGRSARILFVAMERGGKFNPLEEPAFADTQGDFRQSIWRFSAGSVPKFLQDAVVRAREETYAFLNKVVG